MKVNMHEAKSQLSKLGERAWEGEEIIIAKAGEPYLDLLPHTNQFQPRTPGKYADQIAIPSDFNEELEDLSASFEIDL